MESSSGFDYMQFLEEGECWAEEHGMAKLEGLQQLMPSYWLDALQDWFFDIPGSHSVTVGHDNRYSHLCIFFPLRTLIVNKQNI